MKGRCEALGSTGIMNSGGIQIDVWSWVRTTRPGFGTCFLIHFLQRQHFSPSACSREMCLVFDKSLLCISSNLEIGTLSRLFLLCATRGLVYANHFDILYSFGVR